jgi:hypothetical protein
VLVSVTPSGAGDPFAPVSAFPRGFRKPFAIFVLGFGVLTALGSVVGEVLTLRTYLAYPSSPRSAAVEDAHPGEWVKVSGVALRCDGRRIIGDYTYVLGRSVGGRDVLASFRSNQGCEPRPRELTGILEGLHPNLARTLDRNGFPLPPGGVTVLCTWCGPGNELTGCWILAALILVGALLVWVGLSERRKLRAESSSS